MKSGGKRQTKKVGFYHERGVMCVPYVMQYSISTQRHDTGKNETGQGLETGKEQNMTQEKNKTGNRKEQDNTQDKNKTRNRKATRLK